jgi:hypothetical protein
VTSRSGNGPDLQSALVLAVMVIAALAASLIQRLNSPLALVSPLAKAVLAVGAITITAALVRQRQVAVRRALSSRTHLALTPADEFTTDPESVLRFASQLARTEPVVSGWLSRPALAIRVVLGHDEAGRLTYTLGVPDRSLEVVREALRGYRGIELSEVPPPVRIGDATRASARVELVLARPSVEPLRALALAPDPLLPFAAAFAGGARGDVSVAACVDLLPATGVRQRRLRRVLRRQARRLHRARPDFLTEVLDLGRRTSTTREPVENAERRDASAALDAKLRDAGPLFEAQVLIRADATHPAEAKAEVERLLAAFAPLASSRNWFRASGLRLPGVAFLGSDLPIRRKRFDRRFGSGLFRPTRRNIVTTRELMGLLKPPTQDCLSENVVRSGALLPEPPDLPEFDPADRSLIPLGRIHGEQGERIVGIRTADTFFTYVAGRSRFGKTEWAIASFVQRVLSGEGGLFLDPAGDALDRIRPYLTDPEVARRVVEIDLGPGRAEVAQPGWNLFELRGAGPEESEARVEAVVDAFASALGWGERSTRAINLMTQAASALAEVARLVDPAIAPTIFQIPTLLSDEDWREAIVPLLPRSGQEFWRGRFGRLSEEAITPVTNIIDRLRSSMASATLLGQSVGSYSARAAMDEAKIVLANPGSGGARSRLMANLIVFDYFYSAIARGATPAELRSLFNLYCDEIQTFDGGETKLPLLIEVGAKYGIRGTFLNQNPERLSAATLNALMTNRSVFLTTNLNSQGARLASREFGGEPSAEAISRLPRYSFVGQVNYRGDVTAPFAVGGIRVEDALGFEGNHDGVGKLREISGEATRRRTPADAISHLETLDEAILSAVGDLHTGRKPESKSSGGYSSGIKLGEPGS